MTAEILPDPGDRLPIGGSPLQCRIADAAIELFYTRGALATTVRDITGACGLTPGALYNHFSSKEHLLYVLVRDIHQRVDSQMAAIVADAGPDPVTQLTAAVRMLVAHTAGFKKQSRVANREFTILQGVQRQEIRSIRRQMRDRFAGILLAGASQGAFTLAGGADLTTATLTAATITIMCVHISEWTLENFPLSMADLQDRYTEMALRIAGAATESPLQ